MNPERYQRLKKLMIEALELPTGQHAAFADQACGDDKALRVELLRMLRHSIDDGFLADSAVVVDEQQQAESIIGTTMGRIRIDRLIARGGMGEVYAGHDTLLEREVAVKLIRHQWRWSEARRDAFLSEARTLSALAHPNICQVHDFFSEAQRDFLVMELIQGRTLREILDQDGRPSRRVALGWAAQIADALVSAHEQGIAHRDLKPDNVMLSEAGQIKVLDFGLARSLPLAESVGETQHTERDSNAAGTRVAGTPGYLAPEQALGEPATPASDLWSFGLLLIELLTGNAAFDKQQSGSSLLDQARSGNVRLPADQPRAETRLLAALLSSQPGNRPSARGLRDRLENIRDRPRRRVVLLASAAVLAIVAFGITRYTVDLQNERDRAEAARTEAETLAQFMIQDLFIGLDSVGRLDLLEPVADKAVDYFIARPQRDGNAAIDQQGAGIALLRSAQVLEFQGRLNEAIEVMQRAVNQLRQGNQNQPQNQELSRHLIYGLTELSTLKNSAGQHQASRLAAEESLSLAQASFDNIENGPTNSAHAENAWNGLLSAWHAVSESALRSGDFERSVASADEALALIKAESPGYEIVDQRMADLSWTRCLAMLQTTARRGQVEACSTPLALDQARFEALPENSGAKLNLSNSLWLMGLAHLHEGMPETSLEFAADAERLARELIAWDPAQPRHRNQLVVVLISQARALNALDREDQSQIVLEEALGLTNAVIGQGDDHMIVHNHATVLALLGRVEQARPWAVKLMDSGWNRPAFILLCQSLKLDPRCEAFEF